MCTGKDLYQVRETFPSDAGAGEATVPISGAEASVRMVAAESMDVEVAAPETVNPNGAYVDTYWEAE